MKLSRLVIAAAGLAGLVGSAVADPREDVLRDMAKCSDMTDQLGRLACFDAEKPKLKAALGLVTLPAATPAPIASTVPPMPTVVAPTTAAASEPAAAPTKKQRESWFGLNLFHGGKGPQTTPDQFGQETIATKHDASDTLRPREIDDVAATITDYTVDPFGKFTVTLDNGQVWRQNSGDTDNAHFAKRGQPNSAIISRGAIGSYSLRLNGHGKVFKVTRVK